LSGCVWQGHFGTGDGTCYFSTVLSREVLSADELTWIARDERRWQQAAQIAAGDPDRDVTGIYRVLRNLEKNPTQRLRAGLQQGRLFRPRSG
jgi:hypothetical protein